MIVVLSAYTKQHKDIEVEGTALVLYTIERGIGAWDIMSGQLRKWQFNDTNPLRCLEPKIEDLEIIPSGDPAYGYGWLKYTGYPLPIPKDEQPEVLDHPLGFHEFMSSRGV